MNNELSFYDVLEHVNSSYATGKANSIVKLMLIEKDTTSTDPEDIGREINFCIQKKATISVTEFENEERVFYRICFHFRSVKDLDFKAMWKFLCQFASDARAFNSRVMDGAVPATKPGLAISIVPEKYQGKYFLFIEDPFCDDIEFTENAFYKTATIVLLCSKESFGVSCADDDIINRRAIDQEVERELEEELHSQGLI